MSQPPPGPVDPRIGLILQERYRIVRKIGDGGMGAVYEGEHVVIKRRVAIKVLHPQFAQNKDIVARFQREAEAATAIGHPHIVEVTDMGSFPDGSAYMVLEFLDGRDWARDIQREGPQPLGKVVHILSQVCDALDAAHAKGIVHRDLKPENLFLIDRHGDPCYVKVVDFGISKIVDDSDKDRSLTQTGTALGTPYYMAPEQCQGKKDVDHRADIYSLGVILFQALTAQYPFDDESYPMLVLKICTEPAPSLHAYRPDLPLEMQGILQRMLAKDRAHRYSSCSEVKAALLPYLGHNQAPVLAPDAPRTSMHGPSVLQGGGPPPMATPTGTAYLPREPSYGSVPTPTPYSVEPPASNRGLMLAVIAMLGLIVLMGAGLGAYFATRDSTAPVADTSTSAAPPADPVEAPVEEVAAPDPDPTPAATTAEAAPPTPTEPAVAQPAQIALSITAPRGVDIHLDGAPIANPFTGTVAAGEHRIQATGRGFEDFDETHTFTESRLFAIRMERDRRQVAAHPPQPLPIIRPMPGGPSPSTQGRGTTPTGGGSSGGGTLVRSDTVFHR